MTGRNKNKSYGYNCILTCLRQKKSVMAATLFCKWFDAFRNSRGTCTSEFQLKLEYTLSAFVRVSVFLL